MSDQAAIKIVVDTNLWISFCIGSELHFLADAILDKRTLICFSEELYDEIFAVLQRPKIQKVVNLELVKELHAILAHRLEFFLPAHGTIHTCRDHKDRFLLELAVAAEADYLVTGDADLLVLDLYENTRIIRASDLKNIILSG